MSRTRGNLSQASRVLDTCTVAIVRRVYPLAGRPVIACWDPITGEAWDEVPMLAPGGGSGDAKVGPSVYFPPAATTGSLTCEDPATTKAASVLLMFTGIRRHPYAVGFLYPSFGRVRRRSRRTRSARSGWSGSIGVADAEFGAGGSRVVVTQYGLMVFDAENADKNHMMLFQLSGAKHDAASASDAGNPDLVDQYKGVLRISRKDYPNTGDQEADERLLLADQWMRYWVNGVQKWMNGVQQWQADTITYINGLETALETATYVNAAGTPTPLVQTGGATTNLAVEPVPPKPQMIAPGLEDSAQVPDDHGIQSDIANNPDLTHWEDTLAGKLGKKYTTEFKASTVMLSSSTQKDG